MVETIWNTEREINRRILAGRERWLKIEKIRNNRKQVRQGKPKNQQQELCIVSSIVLLLTLIGHNTIFYKKA